MNGKVLGSVVDFDVLTGAGITIRFRSMTTLGSKCSRVIERVHKKNLEGAFPMRTIFSSLFIVFATSTCFAAELPLVTAVEHQPLVAATERLLEALEFVGAP